MTDQKNGTSPRPKNRAVDDEDPNYSPMEDDKAEEAPVIEVDKKGVARPTQPEPTDNSASSGEAPQGRHRGS
jgi:hypothetical protein